MPIHIAESVIGVFAFDEDGNIIAHKLFPHNLIEVAGKLASIQMGTPTSEHRELISDLAKKGHREFTLESKPLMDRLTTEFRREKFIHQMPNPAGSTLRGKLREIAENFGFEEVEKFARDVNFILTRHKLRTEAAQRDTLIVQTIGLLDDIDKFANILIGRVREWYSIHFPELDRLVQDHEAYLKLILTLGNLDKFTKPSVIDAAALPEAKADEIAAASRTTLGAPFDEIDFNAIQNAAREILRLYDLRKEVNNYIDGLMAQIAPNLRAVAGSAVGARLISLAGGLSELARMPASTIQLMGAEKALFRALKTRARPPKHGVIYQYPDVRGSPKNLRGKIARALSGKIAIAARVDAMSGEFVGDKLVSSLSKRIADVKTMGEREETKSAQD